MTSFELKQERKKRDREMVSDLFWMLATGAMVVLVIHEFMTAI